MKPSALAAVRPEHLAAVRRAISGADDVPPEEPLERPLRLETIIAAAPGAPAAAARPVRFRFAPSPTGDLHIGSCMIAVLNYLGAKRLGGEFILRIEDTDPERSKPRYIEPITEALRWLGIQHDGEIIYQSKNTHVYEKWAKELVARGKAERREDGSIIFKVPDGTRLVREDGVKGRTTLELSARNGFSDFVIWRSGGAGATFLFANAIDDIEEQITHVIRGDDHLTNTVKQQLIFEALGQPVPHYFHIGLILDDGGQKLSKRKGAAAALQLRELGYDPMAVANHLARLSHTFDTEESLSLEELAAQFDPFALAGAPARIGYDALRSRNREVLSTRDDDTLLQELAARDPELLERLGSLGASALVTAGRGRAETYEELSLLGHLLLAEPEYDAAARADYLQGAGGQRLASLNACLEQLPADEWSCGILAAELQRFNADAGARFSEYHGALRYALTSAHAGVSLDQTLAILGRDEALRRLSAFLDGA